MLTRIAKSVKIAVRVALFGFERSYRRGETIDTILGYTDPLTDIPNRRAFERDAGSAGNEYSLVLIDIDDLKKINDTRGHSFGDRVIQRLANILRQTVAPDGRVYRISGDEFVLMVPQAKVVSSCCAIRQNLRKEDSFTVSQGIVTSLSQLELPEAMDRADRAMYRSKASGKDTITFAIAEMS